MSLFLIFLASFAPLPDIEEASGRPEVTDKALEIVGSHGELPSEKTKAILGRLKREAAGWETFFCISVWNTGR